MSAGGLGSASRGGGTWSAVGTATAGTAYTIGIPPYPGPKGSDNLYAVDGSGNPNWMNPGYFTRVSLFNLSGSTAHQLFILRPVNWAIVKTAVASGGTSIVLTTNPGAYSTSFKYPRGNPNGIILPVACTADLTVTSSHYYCVQLKDGTWFFDKISSWTVGTLTIVPTGTIPTPTTSANGGINAGAILFLLGASVTVDPNTGVVPPSYYPQVSVAQNIPAGNYDDQISSVHPGDPMLLYNANATAASFTTVNGSYVSY